MMRSIIADSKYILESTGAQVYREKAKESRESIKRMKVAKLQQKEVVDQLKQRQNKLYGGVQDLEEVQKVLEKRVSMSTIVFV